MKPNIIGTRNSKKTEAIVNNLVERGSKNVIDAQVDGKSLDGFPLNVSL